MRTAKIILGYFLLGVLFFYIFFLWQFPYERLKKDWIQKFEEIRSSIPFHRPSWSPSP